MDCSTCQDHIVAYLYGELDDTTRAEFEAALATCAACANELRELQALLPAFDHLELIDFDDHRRDAVLEAARAAITGASGEAATDLPSSEGPHEQLAGGASRAARAGEGHRDAAVVPLWRRPVFTFGLAATLTAAFGALLLVSTPAERTTPDVSTAIAERAAGAAPAIALAEADEAMEAEEAAAAFADLEQAAASEPVETPDEDAILAALERRAVDSVPSDDVLEQARTRSEAEGARASRARTVEAAPAPSRLAAAPGGAARELADDADWAGATLGGAPAMRVQAADREAVARAEESARRELSSASGGSATGGSIGSVSSGYGAGAPRVVP